MKVVIYIYIASTLIYFLLGDGSMYWAGFNMINILAFIVAILNIRFKRNVWTEFATNLTIGRIIYTLSCVVAPYDWIYSMNKIYAVIFFTWAIITRIREKSLNGGLK